MHFPDPRESPQHRWLPLLCGVIAGIGILSLVLETRKPPPPAEFRLPPRIPQYPADDSLTSLEATDWLVEVVVQLESQGDPAKVGSAGERGLMQIMERTWAEVTTRHFGEPIPFDQAFDPDLNRQVGRQYLGDLQVYLYDNQKHWRSDLRSLLLASYNAGPQRVQQAGFDLRRLPKSVQSYATRGSALHDWYLGDQSEEMRQKLIDAEP